MPTFLPKGRLIAFRVDLSACSVDEYEQCKDRLEGVAEMVSIASNRNLKVYWQFKEPISDLVQLPQGCRISPWAGKN